MKTEIKEQWAGPEARAQRIQLELHSEVPDSSMFRGTGGHCLLYPSRRVLKGTLMPANSQACEAACHNVSTVRKQRDQFMLVFSLLFLTLSPQSMGWCPLHPDGVYLPQ